METGTHEYLIDIRLQSFDNPCPGGGRCHYIEVFPGKKPIAYYCEHFQGVRCRPSVQATYLQVMASKDRCLPNAKLTIFCNDKATAKLMREKEKQDAKSKGINVSRV